MLRHGLALFVAALLLLPVPAARTTPLGKDDCTKLKTELGDLEHDGVRGNMTNGPQWAKTNLDPEKLQQVRRLLEIDEQLQFRCNGRPLVNLPKDPMDADPAAREPGAKAAKVPPKTQKRVKKAAAPSADPAIPGIAKGEPAAKKAAPASKAASVPKSPPAPKATPAAAPPAPTVAPDKAAGEPADKTAAQKAAAAKKTKAKPKADDAYRALTSEPGANPFANQQGPKQ